IGRAIRQVLVSVADDVEVDRLVRRDVVVSQRALLCRLDTFVTDNIDIDLDRFTGRDLGIDASLLFLRQSLDNSVELVVRNVVRLDRAHCSPWILTTVERAEALSPQVHALSVGLGGCRFRRLPCCAANSRTRPASATSK